MKDSEVIKRIKVIVLEFQKRLTDETAATIARIMDLLNAEEVERAKLELTGGKLSIPLEEKKEQVIESAEVAPGTDGQK